MKKAYRLYILVLVAELLAAFICGPHSCEWGNEVYFYFGVAALLLSFFFPLLQKEWPLNKRIVVGFLFLIGAGLLWCAGFMLGSFSILCRLF